MGNDGFYVAKLKNGRFVVVVTRESKDTVGVFSMMTKPSQSPNDYYKIDMPYDWIPKGQNMYVDVSGWRIAKIKDLGERPIGKLDPTDYVGLYKAFMERKLGL